MQILVIGASGLLGSNIYKYFNLRYKNVIGTYCNHNVNIEMIKYDMNYDNIEEINVLLNEKLEDKHAIICAGETKIDMCKEKVNMLYKTNVLSTISLIEKLELLNYHIIFCSSDNIYDGNKGDYIETDIPNPINEYGKMKAAVEEYILKECKNICVIRISKIIGCVHFKKDMLIEWKNKALQKEEISCIKDNYLTPVYIEDVVKCIEIIINKSLLGIYNICGNEKYSRVELCKLFLNKLRLNTKVIERRLEEFNFNDKRPLDTSMCNKKFIRNTGYKFRDFEEIILNYQNI